MKHYIIICLALFCLSVQALAQNTNKTVEITGTVVDSNNEPLIGVNITIKNMPGLGVITNVDGKYTIKTELYSHLIFSYVGYTTEEVLVKDRTPINIKMKESEDNVLEEVVVTGMGVQKKISVTGAISAVDLGDLKSNSSSNFVNSLAGNVAGVMAMQRSGQPGENASEFWIRGISTFGASNSALILVDGFERNMNDISVEDIESFQVLKDASETAIYGSRGANGVVLITTKHGKVSKISINAKVESSYNTRTMTPQYVDGYRYAQLLNEARITRNQSPQFSTDELFALQHNLDPDLLPNVNWQDVVLRDGAMSYRASINLNGGGTNTRYFVSASYVDEEGMYKTDNSLKKDYNTNANARRWNYRMNADIDITKTTLLKVGVSGMLKKQNDGGKGSYAIWNSISGYNPIASPVTYSNGYVPAVVGWVSDVRDNPWVAATQSGFRQKWNNQMQTNVTLEQKLDIITKGLRFVARFGFDTNNSNEINKSREPARWTAERFRDVNGNIIFHRANAEVPMIQSKAGTGDRREFFEAELFYKRVFGDHHFDAVAKYNQDSKVQTYSVTEDLKTSIPYRHQGLAGRVAYNWKYRYFANFNCGYTGSENFASNNRFGFFPAVSVAWNVAEEKFIQKNLPWMNMFKIRYSWGKVGNDATSTRFPFLYEIGPVTGYQWADFNVSHLYAGKTFSKMATTWVSWEVANKHDVGVDLYLFKSRFMLTVDYFHERRDGIFMKRSNLPNTVGIPANASAVANVGSVVSKGFDGNFAFKQKVGQVNLTVRGNATFSKNEVLEYDESYQDYPYRYSRGYQVSQNRGYIALGLFKDWDDIRNSPSQNGFGTVQPGDIKYRDVNGDGIIDSNDVVPIGQSSRPGIVYGMGASLKWKGLDANVHFQGSGRITVMTNGANVHAFSRGSWGNILTGIMDDDNRWISRDISGTPDTENPNAAYPRLEYGNVSGNNRQNSTFWLRDMSYLRLKTLEVGYTLPKKLTNKFHFNTIRVFVLGNNLLTFSDFKLWDPELADGAGTSYPISKSATLGFVINL